MHAPARRPMVLCVSVLVALLAGCGAPGTIGGSGHLPGTRVQPTAAPLAPIQFPQDEAPHHDLTEWWYYTGHFHGDDAQGQSHAYGFELTVFQTLRGQFPPYYAAHFAITDLARGTFHYDQRTAFGTLASIPTAGSTSGFSLPVADWHVHGLAGHDELTALMPGYGISLTLIALKPPVLHGGNGLITYGQAGFSYYYSRPLMAVTGAITDHIASIRVSGIAWMDHQWGDFVSLAGAGWDWFSLQLDNNTEYMLYIIRDVQKHPLATVGTYVAPSGIASEVSATSIAVRSTGTWTSPVTGGTYPSGWIIHLAVASQQVALTLIPDLRDQELVTAQSTGVAYWEGAVRITGSIGGHAVTGQSYVELTGYASPPAGDQTPLVP